MSDNTPSITPFEAQLTEINSPFYVAFDNYWRNVRNKNHGFTSAIQDLIWYWQDYIRITEENNQNPGWDIGSKLDWDDYSNSADLHALVTALLTIPNETVKKSVINTLGDLFKTLESTQPNTPTVERQTGPVTIQRTYEKLISPETYGLNDEDCSLFVENDLSTLLQQLSDESLGLNVLRNGNAILASSTVAANILNSQQEVMGRVYLSVKKLEALKKLVSLLKEKGVFFQIKISKDRPRVDQLCLYFHAQNSPIKDVVSALQEFYSECSDDINPVTIPYAATILLKDKTPATGLNFRQSNKTPDSPNLLTAKAINNTAQHPNQEPGTYILNFMQQQAGYDLQNPAFLENSQHFAELRKLTQPNTPTSS